MRKLLKKEIVLAAPGYTYVFLAAALLTFCPGYPILLGGFFTTLGIFKVFEASRESNDTLYSVLLPVEKADIVRGRFAFCLFFEGGAFLLTVLVTLLRMTALKDAPTYRTNALMNANPFFLGCLLVVYGLFNFVFVRRFFRTGYAVVKPFVIYMITGFLFVMAAEAAHFIPSLGAVNAFGFDSPLLQLSSLAAGAALFVLLTAASLKSSVKSFERVDL